MAMTAKQYFAAIREKANTLEQFPLIVSEETDDGGKAGVFCEVSAWNAARSIIDKKARLATAEEAEAHYAAQAKGRKAAMAHHAALELKTHTLQKGLLQMAKMDLDGSAEPETTAKNSKKSRDANSASD